MARSCRASDKESLAEDWAHPGPPAGLSVPKRLVVDTAVAFPEQPGERAAP